MQISVELFLNAGFAQNGNTFTTNFNELTYLSLENSFGTIHEQGQTDTSYTIGIELDEDGIVRGWFEIDGGNDDYYAEGCLEFDDNNLIGYDGIFELPSIVISKIKTLGIDCSEVE